MPRRSTRPPPSFLVDRSLGIQLADAIRRRGYEVHTLRSLYGEQRASEIDDEDWIRDSAEMGRLLLTKDDKIRRNRLALAAITAYSAKVFCLPSGNIKTDQMRARFLDNLNRIIQRGQRPGPYVHGVYVDYLAILWPKPRK